MIRAFLFEEVIGFENVEKFAGAGLPGVGRRGTAVGQAAPEPVAAGFDDALPSRLLVALSDQPFDLLRRNWGKTVPGRTGNTADR